MTAMRDYVTPIERTDIFKTITLKGKFIIEELEDIFHRRVLDDERQNKLLAALRIVKIKGK